MDEDIRFKEKKELNIYLDLIYNKSDYKTALQLIDTNFNSLRNDKIKNKHKCNRDEACTCIYYGKILSDIFLLDESLSQSNTVSLSAFLSNYYTNIDMYIPFELIVYIVNGYLKLADLKSCSALIENYLLYSNKQTTSVNKGTIGISIDQVYKKLIYRQMY
jgi:hypothetical protein